MANKKLRGVLVDVENKKWMQSKLRMISKNIMKF